MSNTMMNSNDNDRNASKFVEVLTAEISGEVIGHRFGGDRPGPNVLFAGDIGD